MNWAYEFTPRAKQDLHELPQAIQKRVMRVLKTMETNPFQGDVKILAGPAWSGVFRRRMGSYRLLFTADHTKHIISVVQIVVRSEKTYR